MRIPGSSIAAAIVAAALLACGDGRDAPAPGSPRPLGSGAPGAEAPAPDETARAGGAAQAPADPRLLLFDARTALEAARAASGEYPAPDAFRLEERWRLQRDRLDAAFESWDYESDGATFRLRGTMGGRAWDVTGP